jgi:hypothetical protein
VPDKKDKVRDRRIPEGPEAIAYYALGAFGVIAGAVTIVAVIESYSNLVAFSLAHGIPAWHGAIAPVAVDSFIVMGELLLFAGILLHWRGWGLYLFAALLVVGGFAMSVGGNVWHSASATTLDRAVQAIWPVTATAALTGCLIIIKRLLANRKPAAARPAKAAKAAPEPAAPGPAGSDQSEDTPEPPSSAPDPTAGEPRARRAVPAPGLAAARDETEAQLARELTATAQPWPADRALAASDERYGGSRRKAARVLQLAAAMSNGGGHDS